jgi:hypothetical protein
MSNVVNVLFKLNKTSILIGDGYSIIETAKANGLIPFDYLVQYLEELSQPEPDIE